MKLPAEPESRKAETDITVLETVSRSQVESGFILWIEGWMALTKDCGGRRGHASIMCPLAPQYKYRCCVSRLCLLMWLGDWNRSALVLEGYEPLFGDWEEEQWLLRHPVSRIT